MNKTVSVINYLIGLYLIITGGDLNIAMNFLIISGIFTILSKLEGKQ